MEAYSLVVEIDSKRVKKQKLSYKVLIMDNQGVEAGDNGSGIVKVI